MQGFITVHANIKGLPSSDATKLCEEIVRDMLKKELRVSSQIRNPRKKVKRLQVAEKLAKIHSILTGVSTRHSVDLVIKHVAAAHLRILWQEKDSLGKQLTEDIMSLPECQQFDLSGLKVDIYIDRMSFEESLSNLVESKAKFLSVYQFLLSSICFIIQYKNYKS